MGHFYSHLVFRPPSVVSYQSADGCIKYVVPDDDGLPRIHDAQLVWLINGLNIRIPCAWIRQPHAEFVVLYAHQNGEDLGSSICDAHVLSYGLGVDVFAFEYSGYGLSEKLKPTGLHLPRHNYLHHRHDSREISLSDPPEREQQKAEPSEKACCSDIDAAYDYLTQQCDVSPSKIIVFGRSIGSGPAVHLASTRKVGGLVLIAPIASAVRVPLKKLNVTLPFVDTFPNIDRANRIHCPVLVVHGAMDELVPKLHGEKLFEKFRRSGYAVKPLWIPEAKHNNVVEDFHSVVFSRYLTFLEELKTMAAKEGPLDIDLEKKQRRLHHYFHDSQVDLSLGRRLGACLNSSRQSSDKLNTYAQEGDDDHRSMKVVAFGPVESSHENSPRNECSPPTERQKASKPKQHHHNHRHSHHLRRKLHDHQHDHQIDHFYDYRHYHDNLPHTTWLRHIFHPHRS